MIKVTMPRHIATPLRAIAPALRGVGLLVAILVLGLASSVSGADDEDPPPWAFFDDLEQRARYDAWFNEPPTDRTPRVVPLRSK